MAGVGVRLDGSEAALEQLAGYVARAEHPRGMFENIGISLVTSTQHRFETGVGPDGSPWPTSLRALTEGGKTGIKSGRLMASQTYIADDTGVEVGTNVIYAGPFQFGAEFTRAARTQTIYRKRNKRTGALSPHFAKKSKATEQQDVHVGAHAVKMPARPFLGLDDDDDREIVTIAEDWLRGEASP